MMEPRRRARFWHQDADPLLMITLTIIFSGVVLLAGIAALLHAALCSPEGYEDELGFH
jgi:hypothetical protein